jgi:hypothetical protein
MKISSIYIAYAVVFVLMFGLTFIGGCKYGKSRCPTITQDTIQVHDTIIHTIIDSVPYYVIHTDTIIQQVTLPSVIDTVAILQDYYATHVYDRQWYGIEGQDSLLSVTVKDYITQNKPIHNTFNYRILRPQTVINNSIDNSIHYNRYLYATISSPVYPLPKASINIGLAYAGPKAFMGVSYEPINKVVTAHLGIKLFTIKGRPQ